MKLFTLLFLFSALYANSQHPYQDSLKEVFKIDERLITKRIDTTISYIDKTREGQIKNFEHLIICMGKDDSVIRVDKIFESNDRFAFAYFTNGKFYLMQWNMPSENSIIESSSVISFLKDEAIRKFYLALLRLSNTTIPELPILTL